MPLPGSTLRLLLLGAPGAGKGTQTKRLIKRFPEIKAISSGDLLRKNIQEGTPLGQTASKYIERGELVPDKLITDLITTKVATIKGPWILDGFPRNISQAESLSSCLTPLGKDLNLVVELGVPESVLLNRIQERYVHLQSGRVYNATYNPPEVPGKDDVTGEPLVKRSDDNEAVLLKRLAQHREMMGPLRKYYGAKQLLHTLCGDTSDVIYPQLESLVLSRAGPQK
ncbi:adenylate kinase ADK2 KNAG_0G01880 [Huiozyma naganishii CBS 8797]|uniref:GTP:AMP phosphotransferase, mitochondrial n=1 Tax=Huiozyma naganishii (strain ATCC MYA-139 / BCRC 22969 / CBS 8797 / KCTC 17520 / NBRC 10181 / NCYC 3082 / Yp74L-3) TaxID=1071383 RepID=J7R8P6_HUIN7|nr:hypothetical protein KNAG_0G01880 [Kazachstania naganishii CBS 8797]CCK71245.1 hypothetical protein KNAG_0G01880 [Kazachstania naganishii CBS 8797]